MRQIDVMRPVAGALRLDSRVLTLATCLKRGGLLRGLGHQQAQLGSHRQQAMPLGRACCIDQETVRFRRPQAQPPPKALIKEHLRLRRPCQHHAVDTWLIKALSEDGTAHQRLQAAGADLLVDGLSCVWRRVANDRGCRESRTAKGLLDRGDHLDGGAKDQGAPPRRQFRIATYQVLGGIGGHERRRQLVLDVIAVTRPDPGPPEKCPWPRPG